MYIKAMQRACHKRTDKDMVKGGPTGNVYQGIRDYFGKSTSEQNGEMERSPSHKLAQE